MSTADAEHLKEKWTDCYVTVVADVPELRRFDGMTGRVKTVNMNGHALVEFDSPADISWYDIDPYYLRVTDAPTDRASGQQVEATADTTTGERVAPVETAGKSAGMSPLEQARAQGAAGSTQASEPSAKPTVSVGKKLSPLELARRQGAVGSSAPGSGSSGDANESKPSSTGKKPSPLDLARQQGAVGSTGDGSNNSGKKSQPAESSVAATGDVESEQDDTGAKQEGRGYSTTTFADEVLARREQSSRDGST